MKPRTAFIAYGLLLLLFAQAVGSAARTSITLDEGLHITSGYTILRSGDFRLVEEHPPLVKVWEAWPLLAVPDLPPPQALPGWKPSTAPDSVRLSYAAQALVHTYRPINRLLLPARIQSALLAVLLGAVVLRWAGDLWGRRGGISALFLLTWDPNIIAHAAVAGTDAGAASLITLALFALYRSLRRPTIPRLLLAGLTLGLAQGAKTSAVLLLPVSGLLVLLRVRRRRIPALLLLLTTAGLTLWAVYGFEVGRLPGVLFPIPAASHAIPYRLLRSHLAEGHAAYLLGQNSSHGWWYYFPVAFALKTPLPTLLLLAVSIARGLRGAGRRLDDVLTSPVWLFPLLYGLSSLFSPLNIGYRHLLPILPFVFLAAAGTLAHDGRRPWAVLRYALLAWLALGTVRMFPHYLAYFNELAGGPDNGWRYLADSNTDWGQAYNDLARFQREHGLGPVRLSAFVVFYDPAIYGVEYEPLTPLGGDTPPVFPSRFAPPPGDYVISATTLDGIPLVDPEMYSWFRLREPEAKIGHVLFYYHVPPRIPPPTWLAQCTVPLAPLTPPVIAAGFGPAADGLRQVYFDCTQAWLYPTGGQSPGWYALHRERVTAGDRFIAHRLAAARLSFEQKRPRETPPFSLYEYEAGPEGPPTPGTLRGASALTPLGDALAGGTVLSAPVALDGPLAFLGYTTSQAADALVVTTWWRVTARPDRPFSLMGHLLDADGEVIAVGDGLGVPWEQLRPGDILVQRHRLPAPPGEYYPQVGAYWLETMERWSLPGGDCLILPPVAVR